MFDFRIYFDKEKPEKTKLFQFQPDLCQNYPAKTLMLTKCVNCNFFVESNDKFCLNCGIKNPTKPLNKSKFNLVIFFLMNLILTAIILLLIASSISDSTNRTVFIQALFTAIFLGTIISSFLEGYFFSHWRRKRENSRRDNNKAESLREKKNLIQSRINELNKRLQGIDTILDKIEKNDGENLQEVRRKLLSAREIIASQFARYELQNRKIEIVRLQNEVLPYLYNLENLNESEIENGLVTIENTRTKISKIRRSFQVNIAIDYQPVETVENTFPEKENFLAQLAETESSCEKLREALLSRQAARALHDFSPIEENLKLPSAKEISHAAESFNIQTTLTDFSESFEELEREYKRLRAEEEIGQKLLAE